ncbi:hypothetical protein HOC37_03485 [bacterium]|jgi:antitoxin (DNA-binding transcriptional repressor) of toxin-antitoxin stability system|nr:hypothetical protein [bacterium]MBT4552031.1 hypothetical protein [bacterium]MBT5988082.1 hypothetical protein [bacterium]
MLHQLSVGTLKTHFSQVITEVTHGEKYVVLRGKKKEKVALIVPYEEEAAAKNANIQKRKLGAAKNEIKIKADFDELPNDILKAFGV